MRKFMMKKAEYKIVCDIKATLNFNLHRVEDKK